MTAEPRFDHDLPYGKQGEFVVAGTIDALKRDLCRIEDKRKRRLDNKFYIEIEHDPGRQGTYQPSGLSVTDSDLWAFVIGDTEVVVVVPAQRLRAAIFELGLGKRVEEADGSCPTRGVLLDFNQMIAPILDVLDSA